MPAITRRQSFQTTHKLGFEISHPTPIQQKRWNIVNVGDESDKIVEGSKLFRIGTVNGLFNSDEDCIYVIAIINLHLHNGHFVDAMEWFENAAEKSGRDLVFCEIINPRFGEYLKHHGYSECFIHMTSGYRKSFNAVSISNV